MLRLLLSSVLTILLLASSTLSAAAQDIGAGDQAEFRRIIAEQIAAFNADDGNRAFGFAAPVIQQIFQNPDNFMSMVKKGYAPVYRQQSFSFGEVTTEFMGKPTQRVTIVDVNGKLWTALYSLEKQPDGTWKISGCTLVQTPAADA